MGLAESRDGNTKNITNAQMEQMDWQVLEYRKYEDYYDFYNSHLGKELRKRGLLREEHIDALNQSVMQSAIRWEDRRAKQQLEDLETLSMKLMHLETE